MLTQGWKGDRSRHSAAAKRGWLKRRGFDNGFHRGTPQRAARDVLAKKLKQKQGISDPYGLATHLIKKGVKMADGTTRDELAQEILLQFKAVNPPIHLNRKQAYFLAGSFISSGGKKHG